MCHISRWRSFSLYCFQSIRETGWPPSISGRLTYRFPSSQNLAPSSDLWQTAKFISSQRCVLTSPRPHSFSPGSWLLFPPFSIHASLPRRLACPVFLSRVSPPGSPGGSEPLSGVGHCDQPREVQPRALSGCTVSWGGRQCPNFCGFSIARMRLQASVNRWRVSVLRRSSRQSLAFSAGDAFLDGSSRPGGEAPHAVPPTMPLPVLGSGGSVNPDSLVSGLSSGSAVVAPLTPPLSGAVSTSGVSRPGLLVRRLGCGLGGAYGPSHCFRPLERRQSSALHQRQRASCGTARAPPLPVISGVEDDCRVLRQHQGGGLPSQGGGYEVSLPERYRAGYPPLVRVARHPSGSAIYSGLSQRPGRHSVSPSPAASYRVVPQSGGVSIFASSVASPDRLICHLRESPLFDLFLSLPGPSSGGHGRVSPVLGRSPGIRFSSVVHHSQSSCQTLGVSRDGAHLSGSVLAPEALVSGPPPAVAGTSSGSAGAPRPPAPAAVSSALPGSPQASTSCLETLRRFTRAAGFSSTVASQASLARRPSSRKAYQLKWSVYRSWCHSHGHSVSRPTLSKVADFLCWLWSARGLSVSSIKGYRSMLSAVFRFHLPSLFSDPVIRDLLRSFCISSAERQLRPPAWDLSGVLRFLNSSTFEPLSRAPLCALTQKVLLLLALATTKRVGELQALSSVVTFGGGDACLSYVPQFVAKSESLTRSIPRSFLVKSLSDFAAGLDADLLLCPVWALRVYLDRSHPLAPVRHRLIVSPRRPSRALSKNAVSFFLRDVITAAGAARPEVGSVRAHDIRGVSTSVAFHRNWSVSAILESATWSSSSVFSSFYLRDIQQEYDGLCSLGPFMAAGSRIE